MLNPLKIQTNGNEDILNDSLKAFFNNIEEHKQEDLFLQGSNIKSSSGNPNTLSSSKKY